MTLQDVNKTEQDQAEAQQQRPPRRREPADRRPKKSEADRRRLEALTELVRDARANGDSLTGPSGLLKDLTKMVLEISLEEEMTEHLGHGKHESPTPGEGDDDPNDSERIRNVRNGTRTKTVLTDNVGTVEVQVPRDRAGTFELGDRAQTPPQARVRGAGRAVVDGEGPDDR
jgi:Transposase and inactivated derivatives